MTNLNEIEIVQTPEAPPPFGHYVQATVFKDLVFVSGQLAPGPDGSSNADMSFEAQTRQALENVLAIVRAAGSAPDRIVKVTAYIVGVENWSSFNKVYAEIFGGIKPARAVVPVPELHNGYLVELEAIAARV